MKKVFLALGSNVGNREENIRRAVELLKEKIFDIKIANLYKTAPVGVEEQPEFLNTAIVGYTDLTPQELLKFVKDIEKKVGRIKRFRWGPREIDIDILFYENIVVEEKELIIPHPRIQEREFVLRPLLDLEPDFVHPKLGLSVKELYKRLSGGT